MHLLFVGLWLLLATTGYAQSRKYEVTKLPSGELQLVAKGTKKPIQSILFSRIYPTVEGSQMAVAAGKFNFINSSGNLVAPVWYDSAMNFSEGLAPVKRNGQWGYIDPGGRELILPQYKTASQFHDGVATVYDGIKRYYIDRNGTPAGGLDLAHNYGFNSFEGFSLSNNFSEPPLISTVNSSVIPAASCPANVDFEDGNFNNWNCFTGTTSTSGTATNINVSPSSPVGNRHSIISNSTAVDPYGLFPLASPNGSSRIVKLGNDVNGAQAERIRYTLQVPNTSSYSITFHYAVVFQDPGHSVHQQPRMTARLIDAATGLAVPCADFLYISASNIPGFYNSPNASGVRVKSWTPVFVNLSAYAGKTMHLEFTTADCTLGGHWGYAYVDVGPCNQVAVMDYKCNFPNITKLTGPPGFQSYKWYSDDFSSTLGTSQVISMNPGPPLGSNFWVVVTPYNGESCKDTIGVKVTATYPVANAGPDKTVCMGSGTTIGTAGNNFSSYSWLPATGMTGAQSAIATVVPMQDMQYILTVTDSNSCSSTDTVNVKVNPLPQALFSTNQSSQCLSGNQFVFTNNSASASGGLQHKWFFGDGQTSTALSPVHQYQAAGTYQVKLVVDNGQECLDSITQQVIVHPEPQPLFSINQQSQCLTGNQFSFSNQSGQGQGNVHAWSFGDGNQSGAVNPSHNYQQPGNFQVKLQVTTSQGCVGSIQQPVTVHAMPQVNITSSAGFICKGSTLLLSATGASQYQWSPSQDLSCVNCPSTMASPPIDRNYIVTGTDANGCVDKDTVRVQVIQPLRMTAKGDSICVGKSARLMASGAANYQWSPSSFLNNTNTSNPISTPPVTTQYQVIGYDGYNCFSDTAIVIVDVGTYPEVKLGPDLLLATGTLQPLPAQLINGPVKSWKWSPSTNLSCSACQEPVATVKQDIQYIVRVESFHGCVATDTINIKAFCESSQVYLANAFTPDGDGINDVFFVQAKGVVRVRHFRVYNRWGEIVFEKAGFTPNDPAFGWDGRIRGTLASPDVFVYTAEVICENGTTFLFKGNVSLLK
jgi:gliding motility-associated-like protein